jgi:hypothetical protein
VLDNVLEQVLDVFYLESWSKSFISLLGGLFMSERRTGMLFLVLGSFTSRGLMGAETPY